MKSLVLFLLLGWVSLAIAAEPVPGPENTPSRSVQRRRILSLGHIRTGVFYASQPGVSEAVGEPGWLISGEAGWHPELRVLPFLAIVPSVGLGILKSQNFGELFLLIHYAVSLHLNPWRGIYVEGGGGGQTWTNHGTFGAISASGGYKFTESPLFGAIDRLWIGWTSVMLDRVPSVSMYKIGVGFVF